MTGRKPPSRSTLTRHSFPPFYACYLLKSVQTPKSTATYIGSTPNPPRRIRQHNGEIAAGAWKTKHKRPWIMQMIVHGFPSKLAALQFEWAWQHPHVSRHLRSVDGKPLFNYTRKLLKTNILVVRAMISSHPYNTWPLHVKLFTNEAVRYWNDAGSTVTGISSAPLEGFACSVELEGVDGKSGQVGSGRKGAISVNDELFTSRYLSKNTTLLASGRAHICSICGNPIHDFSSNHMANALCPQASCTGVAHLTCLAKAFLATSSSEGNLIPRGGKCPSCQTYVLWGDIIRGCYRRASGGAPPIAEDEDDDDDEEHGHLHGSEDEPEAGPSTLTATTTTTTRDPPSPKTKKSRSSPRARKLAATTTTTKRSKAPSAEKSRASKPKSKSKTTSSRRRPQGDSSEGEVFDLDAVSSVSESDTEPPPVVTPKRGRPRKVPLPAPRLESGTNTNVRRLPTSPMSLARSMSSLSLTPAPRIHDEIIEIESD